ncbi:MAG: N(G),N(G)-dimethylarginine dimethylaminohydrolase [Steroidobacteraceae bacterium]|nr:N(G),N(G)-dimethylarginine dimethylaminohydrolase [Steroidobacteraceae bacterium]
MIQFTQAIVRLPGAELARGLSSANLGAPDLDLAMQQHAAYCAALRRCGLNVISLPADPQFPDGTFVEDTAVIAERSTLVTRPGAPSRLGEVPSIHECLRRLRADIRQIRPPGTLDGGDVCQAGTHFFVGISARTSPAGAWQFCEIQRAAGYTASTVDVRGNSTLLHLKSGIAYLGENRLLIAPGTPITPEMQDFERIAVRDEEAYAANCVRVNDQVLIAEGYPRTAEALRGCGYSILPLAVSEFRKLDGGLSCLSLRF